MLSVAYPNSMTNQHSLKKSLQLMNNSVHFQSPSMSFPKHNLLKTRFNSPLQLMTQTSKQESSNEHHWYTSNAYSPGITKIYFIQALTKCFKPSHNISLGRASAHKLKTWWNIATLATITRHIERSMDMYLFQTSNKLLSHGTWLQFILSNHGSFHSCHIPWNQKSL